MVDAVDRPPEVDRGQVLAVPRRDGGVGERDGDLGDHSTGVAELAMRVGEHHVGIVRAGLNRNLVDEFL